MPLSPGDKVGPYEILAPIGSGGMGEVWKARDTRLNRTVAIKRLNGAHGARFEQEARAIAALNHPHICQIHDIGTLPEGSGYLVLEYIEGQPLRGPIPLERALRFAVQIAEALEAAHSKNILHRDLKPGNILATSNEAKLLDFGLAKMTGDENETRTMGISGTPLYMSPEQAEGKALDARSDIFSFGSVLYELLAGRKAFDSLAAVLRDDPAPLDSPMLELITKCLKKQPRERYQSMTEVRAALEQVSSRPCKQQRSIAVLPFANMSADKEQEFFSDGLAEEILNLLAKIPGIKVIARTSSFSFRGKEQDIRKIAEALDVKTILEGSVRRSGNRIRVTAQLIDAADGSHLWSERYDRELTDIFEVQLPDCPTHRGRHVAPAGFHSAGRRQSEIGTGTSATNDQPNPPIRDVGAGSRCQGTPAISLGVAITDGKLFRDVRARPAFRKSGPDLFMLWRPVCFERVSGPILLGQLPLPWTEATASQANEGGEGTTGKRNQASGDCSYAWPGSSHRGGLARSALSGVAKGIDQCWRPNLSGSALGRSEAQSSGAGSCCYFTIPYLPSRFLSGSLRVTSRSPWMGRRHPNYREWVETRFRRSFL
jgi:serine/threonine protein kinase